MPYECLHEMELVASTVNRMMAESQRMYNNISSELNNLRNDFTSEQLARMSPSGSPVSTRRSRNLGVPINTTLTPPVGANEEYPALSTSEPEIIELDNYPLPKPWSTANAAVVGSDASDDVLFVDVLQQPRAPVAVIDLCTPNTAEVGRRARNRSRMHYNLIDLSMAIPTVDLSTCPPAKPVEEPVAKRRLLDDSDKEEAYKCPICLEYARSRTPVIAKCGHIYCGECIKQSLASQPLCPMCKKKITLRQLNRVFL